MRRRRLGGRSSTPGWRGAGSWRSGTSRPSPTSATWGPTPVAEAIKVCEEILEAASGDRKAESRALNLLAHLRAEQGELDRARDLYRQSRALLEEYGMKFSAALTSLDSGLVELIAGDPEVAEAELRRDYEELDRMGESNYRATIAAFLAEALYRQERLEDAEKFAGICREIAAADDLVSQICSAIRSRKGARAAR